MASTSDTARRGSPAWLTALGQHSGFIAREWADVPSRAAGPDLDYQADRVAEAFREGREAGLAEADLLQHEAEAARERLRLSLARLDEAAQAALSQHLAETVAWLCAEAIAPHMIDCSMLADRCARLAASIGEAPDHCTLHLNPADVELLDPALASEWALQPDPALPRGALRLEGREGMLRDGPEEWRRAFAAALAGEGAAA